jgi:hypothetical protein
MECKRTIPDSDVVSVRGMSNPEDFNLLLCAGGSSQASTAGCANQQQRTTIQSEPATLTAWHIIH